MRTFDKAVVAVFTILAVLAAIFGVGTIIFAYTKTKPSLEQVHQQTTQALQFAENAVRVLEEHPDEVDKLTAPTESGATTAAELPAVVGQTARVSKQAADTLDATASSLRSIPSASDLFLPNDALEANATSLAETADSLRHLGPRLESLEKKSRELATDANASSEAADKLQVELKESDITLSRLAKRLEETRRALEKAGLPKATARQVSLQGGVYILLSALLFGMAGIWKRLSTLD